MSTNTSLSSQESEEDAALESYATHYKRFASVIYEEIRQSTWEEDIGQQSWLTVDEQKKFISLLDISPASLVLDVASGSGGTTLNLARLTGCKAIGIDILEEGITNANALAADQGKSSQVRFQQHDASVQLPFDKETFDAVICIDAINHLPNRTRVLEDWKRVLKPGGRILFTDPIIMTGPLSNEEIAIRSSVGYYLFVPPNEDKHLIQATGLNLLVQEDVTENVATIAGRWLSARAKREKDLRQIEGDKMYEEGQKNLAVSERLARERRLSRFVYAAQKPV